MNQWVDISFDCLPLRTITRTDIPIDASPKYRARCERIKAAMETHGTHNTYYLQNALCTYHLTNEPNRGTLEFRFEGTAITDAKDLNCKQCHLDVELIRETCDWINESIVEWFRESVHRSVGVEFDRFIQAGDLNKAKDRMEQIQAASDESDGFMGMYL